MEVYGEIDICAQAPAPANSKHNIVAAAVFHVVEGVQKIAERLAATPACPQRAAKLVRPGIRSLHGGVREGVVGLEPSHLLTREFAHVTCEATIGEVSCVHNDTNFAKPWDVAEALTQNSVVRQRHNAITRSRGERHPWHAPTALVASRGGPLDTIVVANSKRHSELREHGGHRTKMKEACKRTK